MIISFYDRNFKGLQNNASLIVDDDSFSLIRRAVGLDDFHCRCEAFTENILPVFVVVKDDKGRYVYGALAGVPQLNNENQTEISASDLKTMLKSDVIVDFSATTNVGNSVNEFLSIVFEKWEAQVNQSGFSVELQINANVGIVEFGYLKPTGGKLAVYNVWEDIFAPYLKYYGLFMETRLDIVDKKVIFSIGKSMAVSKNIKLWELGMYDYGKWIAGINETQGYVINTATKNLTEGYRWILTSKNAITTNDKNRDTYPIRRRVVLKETDDISTITQLIDDVNQEALKLLTDSMYQENIEIIGVDAGFDTAFIIYVKRGDVEPYKILPCGEIHYTANGIKKIQIGYRVTGIEFII